MALEARVADAGPAAGGGIADAALHPRPLRGDGDGAPRRARRAGARPVTWPRSPPASTSASAIWSSSSASCAAPAWCARRAAPAAATGWRARPARSRIADDHAGGGRDAPRRPAARRAAAAACPGRRARGHAGPTISGTSSAARSGASSTGSRWTMSRRGARWTRPRASRSGSSRDLSRRQRHRAAAPGGARRDAGGGWSSTGNPSSVHAAGRAARRILEDARETIAGRFGARAAGCRVHLRRHRGRRAGGPRARARPPRRSSAPPSTTRSAPPPRSATILPVDRDGLADLAALEAIAGRLGRTARRWSA